MLRFNLIPNTKTQTQHIIAKTMLCHVDIQYQSRVTIKSQHDA